VTQKQLAQLKIKVFWGAPVALIWITLGKKRLDCLKECQLLGQRLAFVGSADKGIGLCHF
jgi:hypothetical protein